MRLAYVTAYDAQDVHHWSGLGLHVARALEAAGARLDYVGSLSPPKSLRVALKWRWYQRIRHEVYNPERDPIITRRWGREVSSRIGAETDWVFCPGTTPVAALHTNKPLAIYTDATFSSLLDFYPNQTNTCAETIRDGNAAERAALTQAAVCFYSSEWAAASAQRDYGVPASKVHVVPFGANLEREPDPEEVHRWILGRRSGPCRLLFLAVDWRRKGGPVALAAARLLHEAGVPVELQIVGCEPPVDSLPAYVKRLGFVSKGTAEGRALLSRLLSEAHFLLLPTLADCTPVVLAEAAAFGLPSMVSRVGGIPTMVQHGINGFTFSLEDGPAAFARAMEELWRSPAQYDALAHSSRKAYEARLNWKTAGETMLRILREGARS